CDISASYDTVLKQIKSPNLEQREVQEKNDTDTSKEQKPPVVKPETDDNDPDDKKQGELPANDTFPIGVPTLNFETAISEKWESQNTFRAQYLVTKEQLESWDKALAEAGFTEKGNFLTNGVWNIGVTKLAQSETSRADFRLIILIEKTAENTLGQKK
ncbi:MAG: hypothetical protein RSB78_06700, partial [Oscillospiraceae bacterium]